MAAEVTKVADTKVIVEVVVVDMDNKALPMGKAVVVVVAVAVMEEEEAVVAEELTDRVDTIVMWVMVILVAVDNKTARSMK